MTGRLAQALKWLGETRPENPSRVALKDRDGFLLIPLSKNFFELPGISQPLDYKGHVEPMVADMAALAGDGGAGAQGGRGAARNKSPKQSRRRDFSQRLLSRPVP